MQICSLLVIFKLYLANKDLSEHFVISNKPTPLLTSTPTITSKNSVTDLKNELAKVFAGTVSYEIHDDSYTHIDKQGLKSYRGNNLEMAYMNRKYQVYVEAYQYKAGLVYKMPMKEVDRL